MKNSLLSYICLLSSIFSVTLAFPEGLHSALHGRAAPTCTATLKAQPPAGVPCGVKGTESSPAYIKKTTAPKQAGCANLCINDPKCQSFSYGPGKNCATYSKSIATSGFKKNPSSTSTFWGRNCYNKVCNTCPKGQIVCGQQCVNTLIDNTNCGACGTACSGSQTCQSGKCVDSCNNSCGSTEVCQQGSCVCSPSTVLGGQPACDGDCNVDYNTSTGNCGSCNNACQDGSTCQSGICTDSCDNGCGSTTICQDGQCLCPNSTPLADQPSCNGDCNVDFQTNNNYCGDCNTRCSPDRTCQGGVCTDTCNNSCGQDSSCSNGQCICNSSTDHPGEPACQGDCRIDYSTSIQHCGSCDNPCATDSTCQSGVCTDSCSNQCDAQSQVCQSGTCKDVPFHLYGSGGGQGTDGVYILSETGNGGYLWGFNLEKDYPDNYGAIDTFTINTFSGRVSTANGLHLSFEPNCDTCTSGYLIPRKDETYPAPVCYLDGLNVLRCSITYQDKIFRNILMITSGNQGQHFLMLETDGTNAGTPVDLKATTSLPPAASTS